jgi:uncharacterized membrane protein YbhN (UPF0104 family)
VLLYAGLALWGGYRDVADRLGRFAWPAAAAALALASANYLVRFLKWEYYLRRLGVVVPRGRSLGIFLAGFSLTVTPGKVGEVLKSYLLRETSGVPMARTAPIVVAERVSDLIALLCLSLVGVGSLGSSRRLLVAGAALVGGLVVAVSWERAGRWGIALLGRLPGLGRRAAALDEFYRSTRELHRPAPLLVATALSVAAWACECLAFHVVLGGFPGTDAGLKLCTFIYAVMTIAGALSFLPGGLGVQEGGMVGLLVATARGVDHPTAVAATFVTRVSTLWYAVLVGVVALAWVRRRLAPPND